MSEIQSVIIHPLVLLSIADHFERSGKRANKRVIGTLLGSRTKKGVVEVTNSFGIPFEEDRADGSVWYADTIFHRKMFAMFKKVNAKEKVIGWYSTGPKIKKIDLQISEMYSEFCSSPILVVANIASTKEKASTEAYSLVDSQDRALGKTFHHLETLFRGTEPEEIGVEQILRDVRDKTVSSLEEKVRAKHSSITFFHAKLEKIQSYLIQVHEGKLPKNDRILFLLQEILNNLLGIKGEQLLAGDYKRKTREETLYLYIGSVIKTVLALYDLVENQKRNKEWKKGMEEKKWKKVGHDRKKSGEENDEQSNK